VDRNRPGIEKSKDLYFVWQDGDVRRIDVQRDSEDIDQSFKAWSSMSNVPKNLRTMNDARLSLSQVNHLAQMADAIEEGGQVENAWAVARNQFKKLYEIEGDAWVKRDEETRKKGFGGGDNKVFQSILSSIKSLAVAIKQASGAARYEKDIWGVVQSLWNGSISKRDFIGVMKQIIPLAFERAWLDGAGAAGITDVDELTDIEKSILKERIKEEKRYIRGFATFIVKHNKKTGYQFKQLKSRASMWWNRYHDIVNQSRAMALWDKKLKWIYGDTMHCTSCLKLNGKVKRASQWVEAQIRPQHPDLACHGFKCECVFEETDEPMSKGRLPRIP